MPRIFLALLLALSVAHVQAYAAQQTITSTDTGGQTRTKLNANFTDLYTNKANASCFASESAFNACFDLTWAAGGSGYTNLTSFVDQTAWRVFYSDGSGDVKELALGASGTVLKSNGASAAPSFQADDVGSGSFTYPGAGVPNSTGSAWGTSYTVGTGANNLVQLNASSQLPAVSAALLTNFPTLNQNTTGSAGSISGMVTASGITGALNLTKTGTTARTVTFPDAAGTVAMTSDISALSSVYQPLDSDLTTWAGVTPGTGIGTWLATPSGANLASALTSALPASKGGTGLTSLGTGVATAMGNAVDSAGGFASYSSIRNVVLGTGLTKDTDTPSAGTDTFRVTYPVTAEAWSGSGWNADTDGLQRNDAYDYLHIADTDDDGLPNKVDVGDGIPKVTSNVLGVAVAGTDYVAPGGSIGAGTATTPSANDNDTSIATTAYVQTELTGYAADSATFTNKTLDVEGTGNSITIVDKVWFAAAGCNNATATSFYDLPTANAPAAACITGTNIQKGVLDFDATTDESAQVSLAIPSDFTGAIDVKYKWLAAATSGSVVWGVQTSCVADAETDDPSWNTASTC